MPTKQECFIVMPFGEKPFPADPTRTYDFEKVYRVLIQRAVREAGMIPVRADKRVGSGLIHIDMFRDLRDRAVVLADLSMSNPNVFYELGIRHVMSSRGTVLMCRKGAELPFDVKLSRTIFYDFGGESLDWEEVEAVVKQLVVALQEAERGEPDSPVHALLESVMRDEESPAQRSEHQRKEDRPDAEPLAEFQRSVAKGWAAEGREASDLFSEYQGSVFASRALGYFCLADDPLSITAKRVANHLNDGEQYRIANELYGQLHAQGVLTLGSQLAYASSYSEAHPEIKGAEHAIALVEQVLESVRLEHASDLDHPDAVLALAECFRRLAGLHQWRWQLSSDATDLDSALAVFSEAIRYNTRARELGVLRHPGFLAQALLKHLLLLRVRDENVDRSDAEGHLEAIFAIRSKPDDDPVGISYLAWFQAIALADSGAAEQASQKALRARVSDAELTKDPQNWEIGGRQYTQLRRFIEQSSGYLRNPSLIGRVSQILQTG